MWKRYRQLLKVPDKFTLVSLVAAGIPADITITKKKALKHVSFSEIFDANGNKFFFRYSCINVGESVFDEKLYPNKSFSEILDYME